MRDSLKGFMFLVCLKTYNRFWIPKSFDTNISRQLFDYIITLFCTQKLIWNVRFKDFWYTKIIVKYIIFKYMIEPNISGHLSCLRGILKRTREILTFLDKSQKPSYNFFYSKIQQMTLSNYIQSKVRCIPFYYKARHNQGEGITTLRICQYFFIQWVIETCFEMLKSSEHEKLWRYSYNKFPNFYDCSEVRSADPPISFTIWF